MKICFYYKMYVRNYCIECYGQRLYVLYFNLLNVYFKMLDILCYFGLLQVNVGCVLKKIMFNIVVYVEMIKDYKDYGFDVELKQFIWGYDICSCIKVMFFLCVVFFLGGGVGGQYFL